jgi:hypothetical protein
LNTPPPNYPPPPGPQYYGGPPPQQNSGSGCLKAVGITCGILVLLGIIGAVMMAVFVKNQISNPNSIVGQSMKIGRATMQGMQVYKAVNSYKAANGSYPPSLSALIPQYIPDSGTLHNDADANPSPTHVSWQYIKPTENSSPSDPMLVEPVKMTVTFGGQTQTVNQKVSISIDGKSVSSQSGIGQNGYGQPQSTGGTSP